MDQGKRNNNWISIPPNGIWRQSCASQYVNGEESHYMYSIYLASLQSSQQFLEFFRQNLIDVKIDPAPYGTHSFRRGGCQYLSSERRWLLRRICEWGGWSSEFSNLTIVKYLLSWNDNPTERREDFFNPNIQPTTKCYHCGCSCPCA